MRDFSETPRPRSQRLHQTSMRSIATFKTVDSSMEIRKGELSNTATTPMTPSNTSRGVHGLGLGTNTLGRS